MDGFEVSAFDSTDFSGDQRGAIREILRAVHGPSSKSILVSGECGQMRGLLMIRRALIISRARQGVVKMVLECLKKRRCGLHQHLDSCPGHNGGRVFSRMEKRLELPNPVPASHKYEVRIGT